MATAVVSQGTAQRDQPNLRRSMFQRALNVMDLVIVSCQSVRLSSDLSRVERHLRRAKQYYAYMILNRNFRPLTLDQLAALELRSFRIEAEISHLEARLKSKESHTAVNSLVPARPASTP